MTQNNIRHADGPAHEYQQALASGELQPDPAQARVMGLLQQLYEDIQAAKKKRSGFIKRFFSAGADPQELKGIYLWGGVGRGKTCLMDMFSRTLPPVPVLRMHFHRFMKRVHDELEVLEGTTNPLAEIGRQLASEARVLCFDEFFVSDIGDAMLLAGLLDTLFSEGVVLVATSNIPPERLYERGLQRERFMPAIRLIERHTKVIHMDDGLDYRLSKLEESGQYFSPADQAAETSLRDCFFALSDSQALAADGDIEVLGRNISYRYRTEDMLWCDFKQLCETPRSSLDYIELARQFHTVLISDVPVFNEGRDEGARRFISLVDEFYERKVKLVMTAEALPESLYTGHELAFPFERTASRLREMQSHEYLASEHLP